MGYEWTKFRTRAASNVLETSYRGAFLHRGYLRACETRYFPLSLNAHLYVELLPIPPRDYRRLDALRGAINSCLPC